MGKVLPIFRRSKHRKKLLNQILHTDYLETAGVDEFEHIRENLRELIKYIKEKEGKRYDTDFADELLAMEWKESELENDDLKIIKRKQNIMSAGIRIMRRLPG